MGNFGRAILVHRPFWYRPCTANYFSRLLWLLQPLRSWLINCVVWYDISTGCKHHTYATVLAKCDASTGQNACPFGLYVGSPV